MVLTEIQRTVLEAASSNLQVYDEEQWYNVAKMEVRFHFIAVLKEATPPFWLRAQVEFGFDAVDTAALIDSIYNEEGEEIEPEMELEIKVAVPTNETKTIDMERLQEAVAGIIGQELPVITHNERLAAHPTDKYKHEYAIEYFWRIGQDDFLNLEFYKDLFVGLERLLNYLKLERSEGER